MIKEALEYLVGLGQPLIEQNKDGVEFLRSSGRPVFDVAEYPTIEVHNLTAFADSVKDDGGSVYVHDSRHVAMQGRALVTPTGRGRMTYCSARAHRLEQFPGGQFMEQEHFIIMAQARFAPSKALDKMLTFVAGMQDEQATQLNDTRVSQAITVRRGVTSMQKEQIVNPVMLAPYRSFPEIEPIPEPYILRLKGGSENAPPSLALFPVDNGMGEYRLCQAITEWLRANLEGIAVIG